MISTAPQMAFATVVWNKPARPCCTMVLAGRWAFPSAQSELTLVSSLTSRAIQPAQRALCGLISQVFPDDCRVCQKPLQEVSRIPVCGSCLQKVEPLECDFSCSRCHTPFSNEDSLGADGLCPLCSAEDETFDGAWCFGPYEGVLRRLVQIYKYECVESLSVPLGQLLADAFPRDETFDGLVPLPLHWWKWWKRGFNQAELLAQQLSKRTGLPVVHALKRTRFTKVQAGLSLAGRRSNVRGAFAFKPRAAAAVKDRHLLLVDDVLTTGSTANACARLLKRAGARRVSILTVARADRRYAFPVRPDAAISQNASSLENSAGGSNL